MKQVTIKHVKSKLSFSLTPTGPESDPSSRGAAKRQNRQTGPRRLFHSPRTLQCHQTGAECTRGLGGVEQSDQGKPVAHEGSHGFGAGAYGAGGMVILECRQSLFYMFVIECELVLNGRGNADKLPFSFFGK